MFRNIYLLITAVCLSGLAATAVAQEKSVKPGINDAFRDPDVKAFVDRFEVESREVFSHRKEILAACEIKPGQTVADIGAGTGLYTRLFAEAVGKEGRVLAVDISQKFLDHIEEASREAGQRNVETILCTPDSTELPADSVDVAFICDTYHHFEFPLKTMASLRRALKPGGRVVLIDFHRIEGESSDWTLNHVRAGQEVFEAEVIQAGFRKVREQPDLLKENYLVLFEKAADNALVFPIIPEYGGVKPRPNAAEPPRAGAKVVFDITGESNPERPHTGLVTVARLLNLYGAAGLKADDVNITVVLHGKATLAALNDAAYKSRSLELKQNPTLPLIRELRKAGVEVFVCGQALVSQRIDDAEVAEEVTIATSALTVVINRQLDGWVLMPIP